MEYTFTNLSTSSKSFDISFYISTNDYISTQDTLLGTSTGAWADAGAAGIFSHSVYIPTNISAGTYYLGFIVDSSNSNSESNENNNYMEMPRSIIVY